MKTRILYLKCTCFCTPHWWHWNLSMVIQKKKKSKKVRWSSDKKKIDKNRRRKKGKVKKNECNGCKVFERVRLLRADFYYNSGAIFAIRCQCHILTAWIVCLVSIAIAHTFSLFLRHRARSDGKHRRKDRMLEERKKHLERTGPLYSHFLFIYFPFWRVFPSDT